LLLAGTNPISAPVVGWIAEKFGVGTSIWLGGVVAIVASSVALMWQLRHSRSRLQLRVRPQIRVRVTTTERA
jgi:hypothetical protein